MLATEVACAQRGEEPLSFCDGPLSFGIEFVDEA